MFGQSLRIVIAALALAGCADAPGSIAAETASTRAARPQAGTAVEYTLEWDTTTAVSEHPALPAGTPVETALHMRGTLRLDVLDDTGLLAASWTELEDVSVSVLGQSTGVEPEDLTGIESLLQIDETGVITDIFFPPTSSPIYRRLMGDLIAQLDLRSDGERWHALARTPHGLGKAQYRRSGTQIERTVASLDRVDAVDGVPADRWAIDDRMVLEPADDRLPESIRARSSATLSERLGEYPEVTSTTVLALERSAAHRVQPRLIPDLTGYDRLDPLAPPDHAELERLSAQSVAGDTTIEDVEHVVRMAGYGLAPRRGLFIKSAALLRGWPELAERLEPYLVDAPDDRTRAFIVDMLVSADTPQAQAVIRRGLERRRAVADPELPRLLQHVALLHHPEPQTVAQTIALHDDAVTSGDDQLRWASVYVLGAQARTSAGVHDVVTEMAMDRIRATLKSAQSRQDTLAALAGLGNAGSPGDAWIVSAFAFHEDAEIRRQAVDALRNVPGEHIDDLLLAAVSDPEARVADQAIDVISSNRFDPEIRTRLSGLAVAGAYHPEVGDDLVAILGRDAETGPEIVAALNALELRTTDPQTREAALRRLQLSSPS